MFTQSDLIRLTATESAPAVSIFLLTHSTGREVRQDPIRLKNLLSDARSKLMATGQTEAEADALLQPAMDLLDDREFWQHQSSGLALFIDAEDLHSYRVPLDFDDLVVVGSTFHTRPLLPVLAADGHFMVVTMTADNAALYTGSRFDLAQDRTNALPEKTSVENDYENPVQASPPARPNVGSANISNAQVYGDGPPDFRKARLVEYVADVAKAVTKLLSANPQPLVLVADAEISGHFKQSGDLGQLVAGVVEKNPSALETPELHDLTYSAVKAKLDGGRVAAVGHAAELLGRNDETVTSHLPDIVRASQQGRIATLLLHDCDPVWGSYDVDADRLETGPAFESSGVDLLGSAATATLRHGGAVHVMAPEELAVDADAVAILRY